MPAVGLVRLAACINYVTLALYVTSSMFKRHTNVRDIISDTHQLLLTNWNLIKKEINDILSAKKKNFQTVKIESGNLTVWNSEIVTFDFTMKSL